MQPAANPAPNHRMGLIQIHLAALLAGLTGIIGKVLTVGPEVITAGRTVIACAALAIVAWCMGVSLRIASRRDWVRIAASGVFLAAHWLTFFKAIQVSSVAVGLLAFASYPLFVAFLEPLFFREKLHTYDVAAALVVTGGLALIAPGFDLGDRMTQGLLWGVLSGALCAGVSLLSRAVVGRNATVTIAFHQQLVAALCTLPLALMTRPEITGKTAMLIVLLGLVFTAGLQMLFVSSLRHISIRTSSLVIMLEPVYGIAFAMLLLGETPAKRTLLGGALVCGAVLGVTLKHASAPKPKTAESP
jgi:drug/metabolite transporter (DMT)-like permease